MAEPAFAAAVQKRFEKYRHKLLATLRKDGSPRISGIEAEFRDGEIWLGMMLGSLKALDLQRDPRLALHSGTEDPGESPRPSTVFDAKLTGRAIEIASAPELDPSEVTAHRFRVDIDSLTVVSLSDTGDHLVIQTWTEPQGLIARKRY